MNGIALPGLFKGSPARGSPGLPSVVPSVHTGGVNSGVGGVHTVHTGGTVVYSPGVRAPGLPTMVTGGSHPHPGMMVQPSPSHSMPPQPSLHPAHSSGVLLQQQQQQLRQQLPPGAILAQQQLHPAQAAALAAAQGQQAAAASAAAAVQPASAEPKKEAGAPEEAEEEEEEEKGEESPEVDIVINNVVCSFSVRCHLNLKEIALNGSNVEYRRENGMVTMKLRHPYTTASIWSSGKITCTGANSEEQARVSARKFSRILQKLDDKYKDIRIKNWRIVNVLGTCTLPFAIKITPFSQAYKEASYEPELHPGVTYKIKYPKATLKIFSTGSITVTAPSVANVQSAIEHIYPKVLDFQKKKELNDILNPIPANKNVKRKGGVGAGYNSNGYKVKKPNISLDDSDGDDSD